MLIVINPKNIDLDMTLDKILTFFNKEVLYPDL